MLTSLSLVALALLAALLAIALWRARARLRTLTRDLDEARERARRADQARETFFDLTTHELRSPLAAVLGYQELLQDGVYGDMPDAADDAVVRIGRSARHLLNLIDGVVELSRLRAGALQPDPEPVNLGVVLAGVADAFRHHARERGIEPSVDIQTSLPIITSDVDRLLRALDLLVTSAVKNPEADTITLDARSAGNDLQIRIHPIQLPVHHDSDDPALRFGIRLAVASGIARLLGGALDLEFDDDGTAVRAVLFRVRDLSEP